MLAPIDPNRPEYPEDAREQVNINIKYEGYIKRQLSQVKQFKRLEKKKIPEGIRYEEIGNLRIEAVQKLSKILVLHLLDRHPGFPGYPLQICTSYLFGTARSKGLGVYMISLREKAEELGITLTDRQLAQFEHIMNC